MFLKMGEVNCYIHYLNFMLQYAKLPGMDPVDTIL
jgi:hypothetical protein